MFPASARRNLARVMLLTALCLASSSVWSPALAQDSAEDKKELKRLRSLFQQAIELEHAGNWGGALQIFREVGQTRMTPQVRYHIAMCEEKLGKLVAALGGYELAKSEAETVGPDFQSEVHGAIEALRSKIPMLTIERGSGAQAASIEVDGVALGSTSLNRPFPADPGPHAVSAKAPGYQELVAVVELAEGERRSFIVKLEPRDPGPTSRPTAEDDNLAPSAIPAEEKPSRLVPYVIGGVGVAALAGAGALFYLRQDSLGKLEGECDGGSCPPESQAEYDKFTTYHYGSQIALGVGVVGVGTAVTLILLEPKSKSTSQTGMRIIPSVWPGRASLRFQSTF
jgi:hypothetical protein